MKIIMLLTNEHSPDHRVQKEASTLVGLGHSVTVLAWDRKKAFPKREFMSGTEIIRLGLRCSSGRGFRQVSPFFIFYIWILFYLMTHKFDAIHCHDFDTLPVGFVTAKLKLKPVVYDAHEPVYYHYYRDWKSIITRFVSVLERFLARRVSYVIATNPLHVNKFQNMGIKRVVEVANYPPRDIFLSIQPRREMVPVVFGVVASLRPLNGIELMINGFKLLRKQVSDVKLIIAGFCNHDSYLEELRKTASDTKEIVFDVENNIKKMQERFEKLHVVLLLYSPDNQNYQMNTSTRLYESMAGRCAVIVSNTGFTAEITRREQCGLVLEDYSPEGLARVMRQLYDKREMLQDFVQRGYEAFRKRYHWEVNNSSLEKIYPPKSATIA